MIASREIEEITRALQKWEERDPEPEKLLTRYQEREEIKRNQAALIKELTARHVSLLNELERKNRIIARLRERDQLTGVYNRVKFYRELAKEIERLERYQGELALIMFYIENFKEINDQFGHDTGNRLLSRVAEIVKEQIRRVDIFARWGGKEFVILTPNTRFDVTIKLGERLRLNLSRQDFGRAGRITCNFGITALRPEETYESFVRRIDSAVIQLKNKEGVKLYIFS